MARNDRVAPTDTSGDPEREARWQALVDEVIAAKAAAIAARNKCIEAELARGPVHLATPEAVAAVEAAHGEYREAGERVARAAAAMKSGEI
jgi:hypothetical protein